MLPWTSPLFPPVNQLLLPKTQAVPSERFRTCTTSPWGYYQTSVTQIKRCLAPRVSLAEVCPDTCWVFLKRKPHFDHHVPRDQIMITFEKKTAQKLVGSLWKKTLVSFTILFTMYPLWIWATHWDFFHKILHNVITMYPTIYSKSSLRVCGKTEPQCDFFEISLQRNLWGHCDYIAEYFMKEVSMSGSDLEWIHCEQNCERN